MEIRVPDIGDFEDVEVVEILVAKGDHVALEDSLVSLESDKATVEIPAPRAGVVREVSVALGDLVSEGSLLMIVEATPAAESEVDASGLGELAELPPREADAGRAAAAPRESEPVRHAGDAKSAAAKSRPPSNVPPKTPPASPADAPARELRPGDSAPHPPPLAADLPQSASVIHAGPGVRSFARELGVDLAEARGTGPHGRILEADVKAHVRGVAGRGTSAVPHVIQHEEVDLSELESYRRACRKRAAEQGLKLSPLHFVMKALALALREYPIFRSLLTAADDPRGEGGCHIGVTVDTERGLVVPVVRDVDRRGIFDFATELAELAAQARAGELAASAVQGASFTIWSLGGIGVDAFSPNVKPQEVAVLGVSRLSVRPRWSAGLDVSERGGGSFEPRLVLPISLSYDPRVIDAAVGARFVTRLGQILSHPAYLLL